MGFKLIDIIPTISLGLLEVLAWIDFGDCALLTKERSKKHKME
jgi:hypothetical protein